MQKILRRARPASRSASGFATATCQSDDHSGPATLSHLAAAGKLWVYCMGCGVVASSTCTTRTTTAGADHGGLVHGGRITVAELVPPLVCALHSQPAGSVLDQRADLYCVLARRSVQPIINWRAAGLISIHCRDQAACVQERRQRQRAVTPAPSEAPLPSLPAEDKQSQRLAGMT